MVKDSRDSLDLHQLDLGNLLPRESAIVELTLVQPLQIETGAYEYILPLAYFPKYSSELKALNDLDKINFCFKAQILSIHQLTDVLHPPKCAINELSSNKVTIELANSNFLSLSKDLTIRFKTANMGEPKYLYQRDEHYPGEVAIMAQFMPTFSEKEGQATQGKHITFTDDEDDLSEDKIQQGLDGSYFFVFVVDRSGSMSGSRIQITTKALTLFI